MATGQGAVLISTVAPGGPPAGPAKAACLRLLAGPLPAANRIWPVPAPRASPVRTEVRTRETPANFVCNSGQGAVAKSFVVSSKQLQFYYDLLTASMVGSTSTEVQDLATISAWQQERTDRFLLEEHLTTAQYTEWESLKRRYIMLRNKVYCKPSMENHAKLATAIRPLQKLRTLAYELIQERWRKDTADAEARKAAGEAQKLAVIAQIQVT